MPSEYQQRSLNKSMKGLIESMPIGQREKNKLEKVRRIEKAARELFLSKGYDETTTREIAIHAGVGMGTVFTYADNKRDLLFLIANKDLEATGRKAEAGISETASIMTNLLLTFGEHYAYFSRQPELSRLMLREMVFYDSGQQAHQFQSTRDRIIALVCKIVLLALARKEIRSEEDHRFIAWVIFCVYQVELRRWLAGDKLKLKNGMVDLERALRLLVIGLAPKPTALYVSTNGKRHKSKRSTRAAPRATR